MNGASRRCFTLIVVLLLCVAPQPAAAAQSASPANDRLPVNAVLDLTPKFCATKMGVAEIGKDACAEVEPALKPIFASLTSMSEAPKTGDAQLILIPTFADSGATAGRTAFSTRELVVYLQWTAKDKSGKTVWVETVQGSAKHRVGSLFTYNKNLKLIVGDTIRDVAAQSAIKISSSTQIRALSQ